MAYEIQPGDRQTDRQRSLSNRVPFLPKGYGTLKRVKVIFVWFRKKILEYIFIKTVFTL